MIINSCKKWKIDICYLTEVNTKQTTRNTDKIQYKMKILGQALEIFVADSKSWKSTKIDTNYLPGGLLNTV